jgi:hypothetical protein
VVEDHPVPFFALPQGLYRPRTDEQFFLQFQDPPFEFFAAWFVMHWQHLLAPWSTGFHVVWLSRQDPETISSKIKEYQIIVRTAA